MITRRRVLTATSSVVVLTAAGPVGAHEKLKTPATLLMAIGTKQEERTMEIKRSGVGRSRKSGQAT
jgi:hypothetical protein